MEWTLWWTGGGSQSIWICGVGNEVDGGLMVRPVSQRPYRVCYHWLSAMPAQHMKAPKQAQEDTSLANTDVTSKSPVGDIPVVTLIRTDTTLDHSQQPRRYEMKGWRVNAIPTVFNPENWTRCSVQVFWSEWHGVVCYSRTVGSWQPFAR